jgi:hypothetical protein
MIFRLGDDDIVDKNARYFYSFGMKGTGFCDVLDLGYYHAAVILDCRGQR